MFESGIGSFGNTLLDRFLNINIGEISTFSRDEKKRDCLLRLYKNDKIISITSETYVTWKV
jgi:UDP-N-acetylglucosamine 4,6-dehydratase